MHGQAARAKICPRPPRTGGGGSSMGMMTANVAAAVATFLLLVRRFAVRGMFVFHPYPSMRLSLSK